MAINVFNTIRDVNLPFPTTGSFGRLQVGLPEVQVQIKHHDYFKGTGYRVGQITGTGGSHDYSTGNNNRTTGSDYLDLKQDTNVGLYRLRTTLAGLYENGNGVIIISTFKFGTPEPNVIKRVGYFDDSDGIYLEQNGSDYNFILRSSTGEGKSAVRTNWDNPFDSGNDSIDLENSSCFVWFTFQYLGVGQVKCGFLINGEFKEAHCFDNFNNLDRAYWRTPNLFLNYEIERTVSGGNPSSFRSICASFISSKSNVRQGYPIILQNFDDKNLGSNGNNSVLLLFRLDSSGDRDNARVLIKGFTVAVDSNSDYATFIVKNPDLRGANPNWSGGGNYPIEYQWLDTSFSLLDVDTFELNDLTGENSLIVSSSYGNRATDVSESQEVINTYLERDENGEGVIYALCCRPLASNENSNYRDLKLLVEV